MLDIYENKWIRLTTTAEAATPFSPRTLAATTNMKAAPPLSITSIVMISSLLVIVPKTRAFHPIGRFVSTIGGSNSAFIGQRYTAIHHRSTSVNPCRTLSSRRGICKYIHGVHSYSPSRMYISSTGESNDELSGKPSPDTSGVQTDTLDVANSNTAQGESSTWQNHRSRWAKRKHRKKMEKLQQQNGGADVEEEEGSGLDWESFEFGSRLVWLSALPLLLIVAHC